MGREVKRVPLDFDAPLDVVWRGYLNPHRKSCTKCEPCEGTGLASGALNLKKKWYGEIYFTPKETGSRPYTYRSRVVKAFATRNVLHSPDFYGTGEVAIEREGRRLAALFNSRWCHHIDADDVRALVTEDRLTDLVPWPEDENIALAAYYVWEARLRDNTPGDEVSDWYDGLWQLRGELPTPQQVNEWSISGFVGHDSMNAWICIEEKTKRLGIPYRCEVCAGSGSVWGDPEDKAQFDAWEPQEPPTGEGWQFWETVTVVADGVVYKDVESAAVMGASGE